MKERTDEILQEGINHPDQTLLVDTVNPVTLIGGHKMHEAHPAGNVSTNILPILMLKMMRKINFKY